MTDAELAQLREAFLRAPESSATRLIAILLSALLVVLVLWLVRRRKLREEYTPIWLAVAFSLLAVSFQLDMLRAITRAIGAWTPSSTIFFLGEIFLVGICLNFAVRLSKLSTQVKTLAQEVALLRSRGGAGEDAPPDASDAP